MTYEKVKKPSHYDSKSGALSAIDVIQDFDLNFCLGNVFKYISRAGKKPSEDRLTDLNKALEYLNFEIKAVEGSRVLGSNMPAGFVAMTTSDLGGLAAYTNNRLFEYRTSAENNIRTVYHVVADQLVEELATFDVGSHDQDTVTEITDLLCQARLLIARLGGE